jgi:RNA polymerase sigma-70 factor (ECF subfamily)
MDWWFRFRGRKRLDGETARTRRTGVHAEGAVAQSQAAAGDDVALLARLGEGDSAALGMLYQRHGGAVYRFAYALSASRETAEESTQEVFLFLFREWRRYDPNRGSLEAWLLGITRRMTRKQSPSRVMVPLTGEEQAGRGAGIDAQDPLGDLVRRQQQATLHQAIAALPEPYRDALVMQALQGMSYEQVAEALRCPVGTVRSRIARAKAELGRVLRADATGRAASKSGHDDLGWAEGGGRGNGPDAEAASGEGLMEASVRKGLSDAG